MCADNGVVEEGVTQTGQEVTAIVAENFLKYDTSVGVMCKQNHAEIFPVDMGMVTDTKVRTDHKIAYGTQNRKYNHQQCSCFCVAETAGGRDDRARRRSDQRGTCAQDQCDQKSHCIK